VNKSDLVKYIAHEFFITKTESEKIINFIFQNISDFLSLDERIYFRGFGSFRRVKRKAKRVRHPKTKKIITIPERWTIDFTPSKKIETQMNPAPVRKGRANPVKKRKSK